MSVGEIFVRLLDEDVDVWRPVLARHVGADRYVIVEQPYDRGLERWEFEPGVEVEGKIVTPPGGLTATRRR